ncbi:hypothetical protein BOKEGFJH_00501 [Chlamydia avium]|uniref:Uncharacterized protein n=1 Tax=Chlamydia avium TaxID=1457141 RepID=A0ABP2X7L6_9CHLA|nr:hypothetical protein [Chlamydia avium]EPP37573.1 hypothetical protein CP10743SC13_0845 [Chlamydia psittaci 10_743_SC13]EPP38396.1 hypothetical protein CP10881SC42_0926 [Chlamydia avium]VVT42974.1 hypothetical protein BOKEGFJH_00501 [Chlamydia avium]
MSSWFAQSIEISLNQTPSVPDGPECLNSPNIKHSITLAKDISSMSSARMAIYKQGKIIENHQNNPLKKIDKQLLPATTREKILRFGSSLNSQLPRKECSSPSSPWTLFSQSSSFQEIRRSLLQDLMMPNSKKEDNVKDDLEQKLLPKQAPFSKKKQENYFKTHSKEITSREKHLEHTKEKIQSKPHAQLQENHEQKEETLSLKLFQGKYSKGLLQDEHSGKQQHQECFFKKIQKTKKERASAIVPIITPPSIGIFTLSYLLTKQGILSDFAAYAFYKDSIEYTQKELNATHEERIKHIKQSIEREKQESRWGSLLQIIEWITPWISICIGIVAVTLGGGIFSSMSLVSGLIILTLTLLDQLNGWERLERFLPGNNKKLKHSILHTVKISLYVISAILSLATLKIEHLGFSPIIEGAMQGIGPALEGALSAIRGAMLWIRARLFKIKARLAQLEFNIEILSMERDDYIAHNQELLENLNDSFENLTRVLQLCKEMDRVFLESLR